MLESPQLAPLNVEEQQLYSEPLPDGRAPQPISKGVPGHPMEEAHFSRLYPGSCSFGHDPKFTAIGEGRNVDRPVNRELRFSAQLSVHHNGPGTVPPLLRQLHRSIRRHQCVKFKLCFFFFKLVN
ncbi:hypothetical protein CHARACLAT_016371 [Characodon lateralis]|uniref:Uncharacterized protein n=1 Tax=Characodon lateralis TaxID=208331 RepID=A0ABU7D7Z3_9TELE|nr:hypothetical protein [Characodon lateralis]